MFCEDFLLVDLIGSYRGCTGLQHGGGSQYLRITCHLQSPYKIMLEYV